MYVYNDMCNCITAKVSAISKWRRVKTRLCFVRFLRFFDNGASKKLNKSLFLDFEKNVKNVFSNYGL